MLKGSATKRRWRGGWCYRPAQESGLAAVGLLCLDEEDPLAIGTYLEEQVREVDAVASYIFGGAIDTL